MITVAQTIAEMVTTSNNRAFFSHGPPPSPRHLRSHAWHSDGGVRAMGHTVGCSAVHIHRYQQHRLPCSTQLQARHMSVHMSTHMPIHLSTRCIFVNAHVYAYATTYVHPCLHTSIHMCIHYLHTCLYTCLHSGSASARRFWYASLFGRHMGIARPNK